MRWANGFDGSVLDKGAAQTEVLQLEMGKISSLLKCAPRYLGHCNLKLDSRFRGKNVISPFSIF